MEVRKRLEMPGLDIHDFLAGELFEYGGNLYMRIDSTMSFLTAAVRLSDGYVYNGPWGDQLKRRKGFVQMED